MRTPPTPDYGSECAAKMRGPTIIAYVHLITMTCLKLSASSKGRSINMTKSKLEHLNQWQVIKCKSHAVSPGSCADLLAEVQVSLWQRRRSIIVSKRCQRGYNTFSPGYQLQSRQDHVQDPNVFIKEEQTRNQFEAVMSLSRGACQDCV
jgi:hypothetical protein